MNRVKLRIGQVGAEVGMTPAALRYYEEEGLIGPGARSEAGYRLYGREVVGRIQFIQRAKGLGLSLTEIKHLVAARQSDTNAEREAARHVVAHKISDTDSRITQLQALKAELEGLYVRLMKPPEVSCGHVGDCACWLPTEEEVRLMAAEIACCGQLCCSNCACSRGNTCDCSDCPCNAK